MAISASSEARVGTAPGLTPRAENSSERHSIECQSRPKRRRLRALDHPIRRKAAVTGSRRGSIWRLARPRWPEQASPAPAAGLRTRWFAFGASGSRRMIATKIASRLVLEDAGFDRYDPGTHSRNPVPHDREASCLGRVLRDSAGSQEPWIRSPPESTDSVDASGREIRPGTARVRSSATVVSAGHTG